MKEIFLTGDTSVTDDISYDKDLLKALAGFYSYLVVSEKDEFETALIDYFKKHYSKLISDEYKDFLVKFSEKGSENTEEGDLFKIARQFMIDESSFENGFGSNLVIQDGLIYEEDNGLNIIYATNKAINVMIENLYSISLYHKHLARENSLASVTSASLQNDFVNYANKNDIELLSKNQVSKPKKRFIKKKPDVRKCG